MIDSFTGEYRFLSNFYPAKVWFEGEVYPTSEHAYQAAKTLDVEERRIIQTATSAGVAKRLGQKCNIRSDWDEIKQSVMLSILLSKFSNSVLMTQLELTRPHELVEGNTWNDSYWGVCNGVGKNILGKMLMGIRDDNSLFQEKF